MTRLTLCAIPLVVMTAFSASPSAAPPHIYPFSWSTVINNGDYMPTDLCDPSSPSVDCRHFNSYNQPSVNAEQLVVMRARSRGGHGGGQPVHGVYTRDMASAGPVVKILDRQTQVPGPNNLGTVFHEPPSFPRIDIGSATLATRGNHQPVWRYLLGDGSETRAGTNGIYTNPYGSLISGASKLGGVADFSFFEVPEQPGLFFDVFPGAPAVTDGHFIVFKGNYTVDGAGKTGVYYRDLMNAPIPHGAGDIAPAGGTLPVVLLANNSDTRIPGTNTVFGSTAPPSAANGMAVFAGFDNEDNPTLGGIYLVPLNGAQPQLQTLVAIGGRVPGENRTARFNKLGEGLAFDGRFVAFWGAWGSETKTVRLQCSHEGNAARVAFCHAQHPDPNGFAVQVPLHQGIFVHDIQSGKTHLVTKTTDYFDDFLYWNFSGHVPGSEEEGDGEPARWRASAFVAVSGMVDGSLSDPQFHAAFKGRKGVLTNGAYVNPLDGLYLAQGPGNRRIIPLIATGMAGTLLDPAAIDSETGAVLPVTAMGIEREGLRGNTLVINAGMGAEETGWAGIYLTTIPQ
ncbi:MAG TPA: hypothetical protein VGE00_04445 [Gammaproteobacteria bacterium]